jgi:transglutaminase-like putative cysteine protease
MRYKITHTTRFAYSGPVFLDPHTVRLRPRCDCTQRLLRYTLDVDPPAAGWTESVDLDGNTVASLWFEGVRETCAITASAEVDTLRSNPFDYLVSGEAVRIPFRYPGSLARLLEPYRTGYDGDPAVKRFAEETAEEAGGQTLPFLTRLSERIAGECRAVVREAGDPLPAPETLSGRRGACRDLAVLFISACNATGLAARFVSGYHLDPDSAPDRHLHAWAEVYVPGGGWRGYDASLGLAVADRHVAVAAGATHETVRPITGTFRGTGVRSRMEAAIVVEAGDPRYPK